MKKIQQIKDFLDILFVSTLYKVEVIPTRDCFSKRKQDRTDFRFIPRRWVCCAFLVLFAPIHIVLVGIKEYCAAFADTKEIISSTGMYIISEGGKKPTKWQMYQKF